MAVVVWSEKAKQDLRSLHLYHFIHSSASFATRLLIDLVNAADVLEQTPRVAPVESDFNDLGEIRGLVVRQKGRKPEYKLMYMITDETCVILAIWNTRRNPAAERLTITSGFSN